MPNTDEHLLTVRIPTELHARLAKLATAEERPVSYVVRKALDAWLTLDEPIDLVPHRAGDPQPVPEMVLRQEKTQDMVVASTRPMPDPGQPVKCPHPKDQRTSYGFCKACGRRVS